MACALCGGPPRPPCGACASAIISAKMRYPMLVLSSIPLLAEEGWRDSLIEAGAPGAKREPDRAKPQLWSVRQNRGCADLTTPSAPFRWLRDIFYGAATPPLRGGEFVNLLIKRNTGYFLAVKLL